MSKEQDKAKLVARAAVKFMRAADRLVNAAYDLSRHKGGSRGGIKAAARYEKADAVYIAAHEVLDAIASEITSERPW